MESHDGQVHDSGLVKCYGPLHKGETLKAECFTKNQRACKACQRLYYKARRLTHLDQMKLKAKEWKTNNKERCYAYNKAWRGLNPLKAKVHVYTYRARVDRRIVKNLTKRIHKAFGIVVGFKGIESYLGCTIDEYMVYLKSKWTPGMSLKNYWHGTRPWEIDHIYPLSSFDKSNPEDIKKAMHYKNTRPLWSKENRVKGAKLPSSNEPYLPPGYGYNI